MYESTHNEVKRKMTKTGARNAVPKSPERRAVQKICAISKTRLQFFFSSAGVERCVHRNRTIGSNPE
jgi:hypothetical protein